MHGPRSLLILIALALAAPAAAQERYRSRPGTPLPFEITADKRTHYQLACRFKAVRVKGKLDLDRGLVNNQDLSGRGPRSGVLPTDNARCTLKLLKGKGPVTLTLRKGRPYTASVHRPGQTAKLLVN